MIVPLLGVPIKGALWYQGEANAKHGNLYACQLKEMITEWRKRFAPLPATAGAPFAFTTVQIAPAGGDGTLRLAQQASLALPRTGSPSPSTYTTAAAVRRRAHAPQE